MKIFSDWQNLEILLNEEAEAFFVKRKSEGNFGAPKLYSLFAALKVLRSHKSSLRYCVFGPNQEWLSEIIDEICGILGFEVTSRITGDGDVEVFQDSANHDLIIDSGCSEVGRCALLANYLALASPKAVFFQSNLSSIIREDAQISRHEQIDAVIGYGFQILFVDYYGAYIKGCLPPSPFSLERPSPRTQEKCLFVVGHARSGSSAITHVLNIQDRINILFEANFHIKKNTHSIAPNFNEIQRKYKRPIDKSFYLPSYYNSAKDIGTLYTMMLERYELVGDKMAFGSREEWYELHPADELFEFAMGWFPHSRYVITVRHPRNSMVALARMIPKLSVPLLVDFWLGGIIKMIDLLLLCERSIVVFHEGDFSDKKKALYNFINIELGDAWEVFREDKVTTSSEIVDSFWQQPEWLRFRYMLPTLSDGYDQLKTCIAPETGKIAHPGLRQQVLDVRKTLAETHTDFLEKLQGQTR